MNDLKNEDCQGIVDAVETLLHDALAERNALRAFAQDIMRAWPDGGDVDGCELEEAALRHGLLERSETTQQERDEYGLDAYDHWYRPTALLLPNGQAQPAPAHRAGDRPQRSVGRPHEEQE